MKTHNFRNSVILSSIFAILATAGRAEQNLAQGVDILDEKVARIGAQIEDLQFRQQQMQKDLEKLQTESQELRRAAAGVSPAELKALDDRIQAVDAARQKDKQAIIDQVAKELAGLAGVKPANTPTRDAKTHKVQKGENLTAIAKIYGVSVAELKKANSLTGDDIKVGQELTVPK